MSVSFLRCARCGKVVSTAFEPVATDTPDKGLIVRAVVLCPECFEMDRSGSSGGTDMAGRRG